MVCWNSGWKKSCTILDGWNPIFWRATPRGGSECSLNMINKHTVNTEAFCTWRVWNPIKTQVFIMFLSCTQKTTTTKKNKPLDAPVVVTCPSSFLLRVYDVLVYIYPYAHLHLHISSQLLQVQMILCLYTMKVETIPNQQVHEETTISH
jgi:hypothetical protein